MWNFEVGSQSGSNRVARFDNPNPFAFARLNRVDLPYFATERSEPKSCP